MAGSDASLPSEMSTLFPGELFSILNMISMSAGFVAPAFAGLILDNMKDEWAAWCVVFWSSAILLILSNIVFILFASAERQPFDMIEESKLRGSIKARVLRASMKRPNSTVRRRASLNNPCRDTYLLYQHIPFQLIKRHELLSVDDPDSGSTCP